MKPDVKKARIGGAPAGSKESQDHFSRHLGPSVAQSSQVTLDAKLAAQLADSDASARSAASKHGAPSGGGLGEILLPLTIHPKQDGTAAHVLGKGLVPKIGQPAGAVDDDKEPSLPPPAEAPAALVDEAASAAAAKPPDGDSRRRVGAMRAGVAMQAPLLQSAEAFSKKRGAALAVSDGQEMKRRIAAKFADALLGTRAPPAGASIGSLDEDDLLVLEGHSSASGLLFQEASLSGGIITTPVLAERRPGEVMAAGLERIRRRLSSLHGDQVSADQSR